MNTKPKKSLFKRILKWTGITFLLLIIFIVAAPFIFKDKIVQIVKDEANKNLNAKVDFGEFDLTLISSFPDFKFVIKNVMVVGVDDFKDDTLANISSLSLNLNLKSVISGDKYQVNSLIIDKARILGKVLSDGKANWDIAKPSTDTTKEAPSEPTKFSLKLKQLKISDAYIVYDDMAGGMYGKLEGFNYELKGDFTQDVFVMTNLLEIAKTTFKMGAVSYLSDVKTVLKADLDMDMPKMRFAFKENSLSLNDLSFGLDGFVAMPDTNIEMDLKFKAKETEFKSILSLIPSVFTKDFASVKTAGKLALSGFAKGTYNGAQYPAFGVDLTIAEAMFKYPSLPKSVNNINIDIKVNNPNGVLDATTIDVNKFHVEMAGNPVNLWAHVKTPISDPAVSAEVKGTIILASVKDFIPTEAGDEMNGTIKADITVGGRMSALDQGKYEDFKAAGSLEIDAMKYKTAALSYEVLLNSMKMNFTNQFVELAAFDAKVGKTDLQANGKIENFMQYVFKNDMIKGAFNLNSNFIDVNELMGPPSPSTAAAETPTAAATGTASSGVVEVPGNIDFTLNTKIGKVLYDNLTLENMIGNLVIRNKKVDMTNLKMNTLGGLLTINGSYETSNPKKPTTAMNLLVENLDIQSTYNAFESVKKMAPSAKYAKGNFTATLKDFNAVLNSNNEPDYNSLNAHGELKTKNVSVGGYPPFVKIGEALKIEQLKNLNFENVNLTYKIKDGRLWLDPFSTKVNAINTTISGSTGIMDQTIDYKYKMEIPKAMFGSGANSALTGLLNQANSAAGTKMEVGDKVTVNILLGGTATKPTVKTSLKEDAKAAVSTVTTQVVNAGIDKAAEEAKKILEDAKAKCEQINAETAANIEKQKQEGYAAADKLVEEAGNPIAKIAAKKAAEAAKKKVDEKCVKLKEEGDAKCQKNMEEAKARADAKAAESKK